MGASILNGIGAGPAEVGSQVPHLIAPFTYRKPIDSTTCSHNGRDVPTRQRSIQHPLLCVLLWFFDGINEHLRTVK